MADILHVLSPIWTEYPRSTYRLSLSMRDQQGAGHWDQNASSLDHNAVLIGGQLKKLQNWKGRNLFLFFSS
ncbi:hypothetical protein, partial [Cypionkella sp.]|uniref:hypothetical protein n=1 Tax=Cypionkella sp. TaxID=2811411 RepID=UPI003750F5B1